MYFNPRTPVGCDHAHHGHAHRPGVISIHAPQWGATPLAFLGVSKPTISIHAPQWGATIMRVRLQLGDGFQSTHPSGVRPHTAAQPFALRHISIHAPQWGATHADRRLRARRDISIHAPQWGATSRWTATGACRENFNPRTPVGCDRDGAIGLAVTDISIHAPQWGATEYHDVRHVTHSDFNPRTPVGCDGLSRQWTRRWTGYFNPRTPVGCDTRQYPPSFAYSTFQSTHPSGVRHARHMPTFARPDISIHAPQWGATTCIFIC